MFLSQLHRAVLLLCLSLSLGLHAEDPLAVASSEEPGFPAQAAVDIAPGDLWRGKPGEGSWWWQVRYPEVRTMGAIHQILGDGDTVLRSAPRDYVWQVSLDGERWSDVEETRTRGERRMFRLFRFKETRKAQFLRIKIDGIW